MKNRIATSDLKRLSAGMRLAILMAVILSAICLRAQAQAIIPCSPGGPPPGSVPRAIAKAPQFTIPPSLIPVPGTYLWVLYENRYLTLLLLPENWPASPAIQVNTMNLSVPSGFGIPTNFELYDVATGPGNFSGYGFYYTTARVVGRDLATGQHRTQIVGISAGGGCGNFLQPVLSLNISPASVGSVQYPQGYLIYHLWSLEQTATGLEPGTITPDQSITLRHLPTGGLAVLPPVDEDQILCAPGVNCPNWANTLMQQMTGDAVHLLLRDQNTGAQSVGWLNLGNAGFGGFNGCVGSVNPCLYQRANLPAPISGNVIDIAGETFIPNRVWVLWREEILPAGAAPPGEDSIGGPSDSSASYGPLAASQSAFTYKLGAINGNGSLLGSMTISTTDGSGGGGGGGGGSGSMLQVAPTRIQFPVTPPGGRGEGIYNIRNLTRNDLVISSMTFTNQTDSPFSFCDPVRIPFSLQPQQQREFRVCFQPRTSGVFQNSIFIVSTAGNATVQLVGGTQADRQHAQLVGYKFEDRNANGVWEKTSESAVAGWRINLAGPETKTTTTDAQGRFEFTVNQAGTYRVSEEQRAGWRAVTPTSVTINVRLIPGETFAEILFGNKRLQPDIQVAEKISFPMVPVGMESPQRLVIKNIGDAELRVDMINLLLGESSPFRIRDSDGKWLAKIKGPYSISPGQSLSFPLRLTPPQAAKFTDHIAVNSNDPDTPAARCILSGEGFSTSQPKKKKLGIHLLHQAFVAPEDNLLVQPLIANQGNQEIKNETVKVHLRIETDEKAMKEFLSESKKAGWVKDYEELHWSVSVNGIKETDNQGSRFLIEIVLSIDSNKIAQPGATLLPPMIPIKVKTVGKYGVTGSVYTDSMESGVEGGMYTGKYEVLDVKNMTCDGGVWEIAGSIESWGFVLGGAKWTWKAKCASNPKLEVVGVFYTGAGGVIFDIFPGTVKFRGVIEGAKSPADFSGWFSGVIGEFNVSFAIAGASVGGVHAKWWESGATMRAMTWSGEVSESLIEDGVKFGLGNWYQDQADEVLQNLTKKFSFDVDLCKEGKVEKGIKKFLSAKLCGFLGRSVVGGIE